MNCTPSRRADDDPRRARVAGEQLTLSSWQPVLMTGLPDGEVEIRLQLVDRDGELVPGPLNDVTGVITVERTPNA